LKAYYNSVASFESQWYLFVIDVNDIYIIHPFLPRLVGTDIKDVKGSDGFELGKEFAKATEEGHWIEYLWPHPVTLKEVPKIGYAVRHDGMIFASGFYPAPTVAELKEARMAYVRQAVEYYKENGRDATVEYYNSPESISDNDIYLRLLDENNIVIVQPLQPQLRGKDYVAVAKTPQGVRVGELVVEAATEEGGWVQFEAQLPNTRASGFSQRYLLAVRHDNLIFVASFSSSE
jgi:signal transduction histidine kinase